jgi:putative ABC transport system substrate-binding protein
MRRRDFLGALGGAVTTVPAMAQAQQSSVPVIGYLHSGLANRSADLIAGFRQGLGDAGYVEGRNVSLEFRWAEGRYERLASMAADLVARRVALIATGGGLPLPLAARSATTDIPIVFAGGSDPVAAGLVVSLNRPGGTVTGVLNNASELTANRFGLLRGLMPAAALVGVLRNPAHPEAETQMKEVQAAAGRMALKLHVVNAQRESDFEPALASLVQQGPRALFVVNDPFFASRRTQLVAAIARHAVPAIYPQRQFSEAGGLMSYGANFVEIYRQAGIYAGRVLRGDKPADLPVIQPTRFELVINLKIAKALGVDLPPMLLALADAVIE